MNDEYTDAEKRWSFIEKVILESLFIPPYQIEDKAIKRTLDDVCARTLHDPNPNVVILGEKKKLVPLPQISGTSTLVKRDYATLGTFMYAIFGLGNEEDYILKDYDAQDSYSSTRTFKGDYKKHRDILTGTLFEARANQLFPNTFKLIESTFLGTRFIKADKPRDAVYAHDYYDSEDDGIIHRTARFNIDFKFTRWKNYPVLGKADDTRKRKQKFAEYHNLRVENGGFPFVIVGVNGAPYDPQEVYVFPVPDLRQITTGILEVDSSEMFRVLNERGTFSLQPSKEDEELNKSITEIYNSFPQVPEHNPDLERSIFEPFKPEQTDGTWTLK